MRKIEEKIIEAIDNRQTVSLSERDIVEYDKITDHILVYLWDTCIASINDTQVTINSGGYHTATTKSRLNAILRHYCDMYIYQKHFEWYVWSHNFQTSIQFRDGMAIARRVK